jgi:hypothetical protein
MMFDFFYFFVIIENMKSYYLGKIKKKIITAAERIRKVFLF